MTQFSTKRILSGLLILSAGAVTSCQTTQGNYADPDKIEIVDDRWNESDARLTGEQMIRSALAKPWLKEYTRETQGKRPFLLVDDIENRTSEQIDTKALFEVVRNELLNSGQVRFLDGNQRQKILDEYKYQQSGVVKQGAAKGPGKQQSADFFMVGAISSQVAEADGYKTVTYQVEMRLTNIETSEIAWTEIKKIKKQFRRSRLGL